MNLSINCFNSHGFVSSKPYVYQLLQECDILGLSEHWLSGPELKKLDISSATHEPYGKCNKNLKDAPPSRGRGYGGVALFWRKNLVVSRLKEIKSDRLIGITVQRVSSPITIINVYFPNDFDTEFNDVLIELYNVILKYRATSDVIVMGDFNAKFGRLGGPRGDGVVVLKVEIF